MLLASALLIALLGFLIIHTKNKLQPIFLIFEGTACGADFYAAANDKAASSPEDGSGFLDPGTTERRRSERVKREKPDYYDASEFEHKRKANNTSACSRQGA